METDTPVPNCDSQSRSPHRSLSIRASCLRGHFDIPSNTCSHSQGPPRQDRALHTQALGTTVRSQSCSFVTLHKLFNLWKPQFPLCEMGTTIIHIGNVCRYEYRGLRGDVEGTINTWSDSFPSTVCVLITCSLANKIPCRIPAGKLWPYQHLSRISIG